MTYIRDKRTGIVRLLGAEEFSYSTSDGDALEEVQVVPVDAVVVELPEVVLDIRSSTLKQTRWVDTMADKAVTFSEHDDLNAREQNALRRLAAVRAERARRAAEAAAPEESDAWAGIDRAEIIRQAEDLDRANTQLREALNTVKARLSAREEELRIASNAAVAIESELAILRRNLGKARS